MGTDTAFEPIFDPESGEVLASSEEEVAELTQHYTGVLVQEAVYREEGRHARAKLALLMKVGDAWAKPGGWAVMVKPPATPARQVVPHRLEEHAEALAPLGLAPREETKTTTVYAKVSDLTSKKAREALARVGLTPETFLHTPEPGDPQVVVVAPEEDR